MHASYIIRFQKVSARQTIGKEKTSMERGLPPKKNGHTLDGKGRKTPI
jgi:hypothetical protein